MRLLIYIHSLENGGAERVVANLANYWASIGWELTVVTVASRATDFYAVDPAVERVCLDLAHSRPSLLAGVVRTVRRVRALRRVLQRVRPDIAVSAMHTANVVLAAAARGMPGLCTFGSEHNFPPKAPMGILWETMRRHAYARLTAVVALTNECAQWLAAHTFARAVVVIPNAVAWPLPANAPLVDPRTSCAPGRRILLGVGRLSAEKNFSTLVATFAGLASRHPGWDLVILGEGPERAGLEAQVREAGLQRRVFLPGSVGNPGAWYAQASLYAMTSHFEGFPNTLVEAMASGLPIVCTDREPMRGILRDAGIYCDPESVPSLVAAMRELSGSPALRNLLASRAYSAALDFSWERCALRTIGLLGKVARTNKSSPACG